MSRQDTRQKNIEKLERRLSELRAEGKHVKAKFLTQRIKELKAKPLKPEEPLHPGVSRKLPESTYPTQRAQSKDSPTQSEGREIGSSTEDRKERNG